MTSKISKIFSFHYIIFWLPYHFHCVCVVSLISKNNLESKWLDGNYRKITIWKSVKWILLKSHILHTYHLHRITHTCISVLLQYSLQTMLQMTLWLVLTILGYALYLSIFSWHTGPIALTLHMDTMIFLERCVIYLAWWHWFYSKLAI